MYLTGSYVQPPDKHFAVNCCSKPVNVNVNDVEEVFFT